MVSIINSSIMDEFVFTTKVDKKKELLRKMKEEKAKKNKTKE